MVPAPAPSPPKAANSTFANERFIARDMMAVRMRPDAPTKAPEMMRALDPITKPAEAAASPDMELRKATTTGMSAPPIGSVRATPSTAASPVRTQKAVAPPPVVSQMAAPMAAAATTPSTTSWPG